MMLTRARLAWRLYRDPRVAPRMKIFLPILALIYLISPIDLIPDVLLGVGQLDDLTVIFVLAIVLSRLARWAPTEIVDEHLTNLLRQRRSGFRSERMQQPEPNDVIDAEFRVTEKPSRNQQEHVGATW